MSNLRKIYTNLVIAAGVIGLPVISYGMIQLNPNMPMETLVDKSDEIVVGKVIEKNVVMERGGIQSKYEIQVADNLKQSSKDYAPGQTIKLSLAGGTPTSSPLTRHVPGMPHMFIGEDVVLFLRTKSPQQQSVAPKGASVSVPFKTQIVGMSQGRFTIVEDKDGKKSVIRMPGDIQGLVDDGRMTKDAVSDIKKNLVRLKEQQIVRGRDLSKSANQKDPLELKTSDQKAIATESKLQTGEMLRNSFNAGGGIPAQELESFKSDIRTFVVNK